MSSMFHHRGHRTGKLAASALIAGAALLTVPAGAAASVVWTDGFAGINDTLSTSSIWTGVEDLPNNGSVRNGKYFTASDNPYGLGAPGVAAGNMYSGGGAYYADLPVTDSYTFTGSLVDYAQEGDRTPETSLILESQIGSDNKLIRTGWTIQLYRFNDSSRDDLPVNDIKVYDPDGTRVMNIYAGAAPSPTSAPHAYSFTFERQGDQVTISVLAGTQYAATGTYTDAYNPDNHQVELTRTVASSRLGDKIYTGWTGLTMTSSAVPEPATLGLLAAGGLLLTLRRRSGKTMEDGSNG